MMSLTNAPVVTPLTVVTSEQPQQPIAISVRSVSKMYRIYDQPQDRLKQMLWRGRRQYGHEFWALKDTSFEVRRGESVGIIGRNGSGKSTLLQMIAGTLAPTQGEVHVNGRVAALLELGSGFNPEFSGRENVLLNGAILGIRREEMEQKFDAIAAFADIGDFIEQPVKLYSSGMVVRLAFAVQAHLDPEVLIVDEALSVGDVYFQHKCMRRIKELVDQGTTLLFVSHSTETVKRFCQRGLWIDSGTTRYWGEAGVAVEKYLAFMRMREVHDWSMPLEESEPVIEDDEAVIRAPKAAADVLFAAADLLPSVTSEVDLAEQRLFLRGIWDWAMPSTSLVRQTREPNAIAGFRFTGNAVELDFLRGPTACDVSIVIDGVARTVELFQPNDYAIERIRFDVEPGEHAVFIRPLFGDVARQELWWCGGRSILSTPLKFHRDPHFGSLANAVERYGNGKARITAVELLNYVSEQPISEAAFGQRVRLRLHAELLHQAGPRLEFSFIVRDRNRIDLFGTTTIDERLRLDPGAKRFVVEFAFDVRLGPGSYSILASFVECSEDLRFKVPMDQIDIAAVFTVTFNPNRPVWYVYHEPVVLSAASYKNGGE